MAERLSAPIRSIVCLLVLLVIAGCDKPGTVPETVTVTIKDRQFTLKVSANDASRALGLGGVETIADDGGMIFIFPRAERQRFWMRNCLSDIDVIFLDGRGRITATHRMKAEAPRAADESESEYHARLKGYESNYPAQFAIELAPGTLDELGLQFEERIELDLDRLKAMAR